VRCTLTGDDFGFTIACWKKMSRMILNILISLLLRGFLNSLRVVFPAACGEFVIPAKAGIQKTRLDSPVSGTGQAKSSTE